MPSSSFLRFAVSILFEMGVAVWALHIAVAGQAAHLETVSQCSIEVCRLFPAPLCSNKAPSDHPID